MAATPPADPRPLRRLLILGGTGEAAALAAAAAGRFGPGLDIVTSLAGVTSPAGVASLGSGAGRPAAAGRLRVGGFGGAEGLARYLRGEAVELVVDATHPFAARISANARAACAAAGVPRLALTRPPWRRTAGDRWIEVADMAAAAAALPGLGRRAFLTVGADGVAAFAGLRGVWFLVRLMAPPRAPLPLGRLGRDHEVVVGRGPFAVEGERRLLESHRIDVVVSKASGGPATEAKIVAAREAGIPVVLVRRPPPEPGERAETVEAALEWIARAVERLDGAPAPET